MSNNIFLAIKMLPSLNFDEKDPKTILLGQIFKIIDSEKTKNIFNRNGVKQRKMMVNALKYFLQQYILIISSLT